MLESKFIEQNKHKWEELETMLAQDSPDREKISDLFVQVSDDLSYARTFYPNRSVRAYLNQLTQRVFHTLYRNKRNSLKAFRIFWLTDLPLAMYQVRRQLYLAVALFLVSVVIGVSSARNDPGFVSQILGESYVAMTEENIARHDPMAVYKNAREFDMFLAITVNNIRVAIFTFVLGLLGGIGSGAFMFYNGIMVGAFQYFFYERNLFLDSFLAIWLHGALEIPSIVLATAAGFCLGRGLLFPGTYHRSYAFRLGARKGIMVMLGTIPLFVIAGFIESFLTRYTEVPDLLRLLLIAGSFLAFVFYFFVYPFRVKNRWVGSGWETEEEAEPSGTLTPPRYGIRNFGETIAAVFQLLARYTGKVLAWLVLLALLLAAWRIFVLLPDQALPDYNFTDYWVANHVLNFLDFEAHSFAAFVPIWVGIAFCATFCYRAYCAYSGQVWQSADWLRSLGTALVTMVPILGLLFITTSAMFMVVLLLLPLQCIWFARCMVEGQNPVKALVPAIQMLSESWVLYLGQCITIVFLSFLLSLLSSSPLIGLYLGFIEWNTTPEAEWFSVGSRLMFSFTSVFSLLVCYAVTLLNSFFIYLTLKELHGGEILLQEIKGFGSIRK